VAGKVRGIAIAREVGDSVLYIHYLGWQAARGFGARLSEMAPFLAGPNRHLATSGDLFGERPSFVRVADDPPEAAVG
jgi:hypothetical protein